MCGRLAMKTPEVAHSRFNPTRCRDCAPERSAAYLAKFAIILTLSITRRFGINGALLVQLRSDYARTTAAGFVDCAAGIDHRQEASETLGQPLRSPLFGHHIRVAPLELRCT